MQKPISLIFHDYRGFGTLGIGTSDDRIVVGGEDTLDFSKKGCKLEGGCRFNNRLCSIRGVAFAHNIDILSRTHERISIKNKIK